MSRTRKFFLLVLIAAAGATAASREALAALAQRVFEEGPAVVVHEQAKKVEAAAVRAGIVTPESPARKRQRIEAEKTELERKLRDPATRDLGAEERRELLRRYFELLQTPMEGEPAMRVAAIAQGDVYGLDAALARSLAQHQGATPDDVRKRAPAFAPDVPRVRGAKYLDRILEPRSHGAPDPRFALDASERAALERHGFVVTRRLGRGSHAQLMHTIYEHDQPLFVSADAVLHAWHMTYDAMLEELESTWLVDALGQMLAGMAGQLPDARALDRAPFSDSLKDADLFIAVARSLLAGQPVDPLLQPRDEVARLLDAVAKEERTEVALFGREREEDFSQMRPRGHYEKSEVLQRYFRAMMWLGRTELRVAGPDSSPRELAAALVLQDLLVRSRELDRWRDIDRLLQTFVGRSDSMGPPDVGALLAVHGLASARDVADEAALVALQARIKDTRLGLQHISSQLRSSDPTSAERIGLPRAFTLLGQRFIVDSWVLGQVVYDRIVVDGKKVERTMPSGVDVAFAALANDGAADLVAARIEDEHGMPRRDGLLFQQNLLAARAVVDARSSASWEGNLYDMWLATLRGLSEPTTDERFPTVMRTQAWSRRVMQAQLSSWAELRHDTILYAKQSYSAGITCEYPTGFVELAPTFWRRLEQSTALAAELLERTSFPQPLAQVKTRQVEMARKFSRTMTTLRDIVDRELSSEPLTDAQEAFLKRAVEVHPSGMCGEPPRWDGWYLELFYRGKREALKFDALVADVHTDPNSGVLHVGTGAAALMVVVVERGGDTMAFSGPVSTYYEFVPEGSARMTDTEWKSALAKGTAPKAPEWTEGWLVGDLPQGLAASDED